MSKANRNGPSRPSRRPGADARVHRRPVRGDALDHPDARPRPDGRVLTKTVYECSPLDRDDPAAVAGRAPPRGTRSRRRSATRRRSSTASTSSRRTAPTTRSSATCPRATASPQLCLFPEEVTPNHHALAARVRAARQLLRRERGQRRRPRVDDGRLRHRLRRADLAAGLPGRPAGAVPVRGGLRRSPARPAATSGTAPRRRGSATAATASSSRTAHRPTTRPRPPSRPWRATSTRSSGLRPRLPRRQARRPVPGRAGRVRARRARCPG